MGKQARQSGSPSCENEKVRSMPPANANTEVVVDRHTRTIVVTRVFAAPREQVFEAWTQPEHMACWWDPTGEPLAECEIDLRPGGAFRFVNRRLPATPVRRRLSRNHAPRSACLRGDGVHRARHPRGDRRQDAFDGEDRVRLGGAVRTISENGHRHRNGQVYRQSRRLCGRGRCSGPRGAR